MVHGEETRTGEASIADLPKHMLPGGEAEFLCHDYPLGPAKDVQVPPPPNWRPLISHAPLNELLPTKWRRPDRQPFETAAFFTNVAQICAFRSNNPAMAEACDFLLRRLIALVIEYSTVHEGGRFIVHRFQHSFLGHVLLPEWVSGLANGFVLAGVTRVALVLGDDDLMTLADELAAAYCIVNTGGRSRPWFSYIDQSAFLWFDECPLEDGQPTHILNGHIHALLGLHYYNAHRPSPVGRALVQGGATTMRFNAHRFRVPQKINRYLLVGDYSPDYLPLRTVRQQRELYDITGDRWFLQMRDAFADDLRHAQTTK